MNEWHWPVEPSASPVIPIEREELPEDHPTEPVADTPVEAEPAPVIEASVPSSKKLSTDFNVNGRNFRVYGSEDALAVECEAKFGPGKLSYISGRRYRWR